MTERGTDNDGQLKNALAEIERLKTLVEASKLINSSPDPDSLFDSILEVARRELGVDRGTLYFVDDEKREIWSKITGDNITIRLPIGRGLAGCVAATGEHLILHDAYADPRFDRETDLKSGYHTLSMLCSPIKNRAGKVVGVLQLLNKRDGAFGEKDLEFLDTLSDHMAIAMENATLHLAEIEKQRMEQELELGREIQASLLPPPPRGISQTELAALNKPCYEVGGDYYDFIELSGGAWGLAIGDVSGKGVSAALIMSSLQAALRVAAPSETDLCQLVSRLNQLLYRMTHGRKYVTFFFARYIPRTGELNYVNAGHNPPFLLAQGVLRLLDSTGLPIGLFPEASYEEGTVTLGKSDTLLLYTDGFVEAENRDEAELGMVRWQNIFLAEASRPTADIPAALLQRTSSFENGAPATDDKTLVVIRRI